MLSQALPMTNECWDIQKYKYVNNWPQLAQHIEQPETHTHTHTPTHMHKKSLFLREIFVVMI